MRKNSSQLIIGVENREVEFVQNDYKIVDSTGECLPKGKLIAFWRLLFTNIPEKLAN